MEHQEDTLHLDNRSSRPVAKRHSYNMWMSQNQSMAECCIDHIDTSISSCALSQLPGQGMTKLLNLNDCFDETVEQQCY